MFTANNIRLLKKHLSSFSIILIATICIWNVLNTQWWNMMGVITFDVACYYGYLPQAFNDKTDKLSVDEIRLPAIAPPNKYVLAPNGNKVLKTTMGMAILYSPFYAAGYIWHYFIYGNAGTGMEVEYRTAMAFFGIFCLTITLLLLQKLLRKYFSEMVVCLTLLILVFGTNAFYYTTYEGCMSHMANCMLLALFLLLTERWHNNPSVINSLLAGLVLGLIILIRPTNILAGILFLFYGITDFAVAKEKTFLLVKNWRVLLVMAVSCFLVWIPQLLYWHSTTGRYFFFSYVGERFYFLQPCIYSGFFSFRKGWLIYTPLGSVMLIGFIWLYNYLPRLFWGYIIFYAATVYVMFSWWSWWYGGSFSCRPMVETYAILSFPMASALRFATERLTLGKKIFLSVIIIVLTALNLFETYQYSHQIIHWDRMSYKAYKNVFLSLDPAPDSLLAPTPANVILSRTIY